ncbi:MAG: hypothetical protein K2W95_31770 [Candidatus Obscuribacterales bacterium]|nr:hypothetical protein [Candidatus Obscuribacterales bacterium]
MFKLIERLIYPLFILTAVIGLVYWYWTTTPGYALTQIVAAIKNKDPDTFEKYVDIENISYHAVDDLLHGPARESGMFGNFDSMIGVGIISLFKPEIAEIARTHVLNFVKAGSLSKLEPTQTAPQTTIGDKPTEDEPPLVPPIETPAVKDPVDKDYTSKPLREPEELSSRTNKDQLASLFGRESKYNDSGSTVEKFAKNVKLQQQLKDYGLSKEGFKGVDYLKVDGPVALVGIKFHSKKLNRNFIIELKMEDSGGFWRITEFSNLNELIATYLELREQMRTEAGSFLLIPDSHKLLLISSAADSR